MKIIPVLKCMKNYCNGAHGGLTDLYPDIEKGISEALKRADNWTTDWYSSKKEMASAKISHRYGKVYIEVIVSDDFDCVGHGVVEMHPYEITMAMIKGAITEAWAKAEKEQKDNCEVDAWSIWNPEGEWVETYLLDTSDYCLDYPPGDYYQWGFQGEIEIPEMIKTKIEKSILYDQEHAKFNGWEIKKF